MAGDLQRLEQLRRELAAIAKGGAIRELLRRMPTAIHGLIIAGARAARDPYGRAWAPRKDKRGTWPLLDKTGHTLNSIRARATGRGVVVTASKVLGFHQSRTRHMVARKTVPDPAQGLGPTWTDKLERVTADVGQKLLGGV